MDEEELRNRAKMLRKNVLALAVDRKEGHIGGAFSITEIMVALFNKVLEKDDTFILSKGHSCLPYFLLLRDKGYNPKISGHPDIDPENGIFCTTGSLGHGLPIGIGMAHAKKLKKERGHIYVLMSDCEQQEGTTWESLLLGNRYGLDNITVIIDYNKLQTLGKVNEILPLENLAEKYKAFGWYVVDTMGHSFPDLLAAFHNTCIGRPRVIIAHTIKGKGVSYMENNAIWHTKIPNPEQLEEAYRQLQ